MRRCSQAIFGRLVFAAGVLASACVFGGDGSVAGHEYFPLGKGKTWKYVVTSKADDAADKPYYQTLAGQAVVEVGGKSYLPLGDDLFAPGEDGLYLSARRDGHKVVALDPPLKVLPAEVRTGAWWKMSAGDLVTSSTCLGTRAIETELGKFETQCILSTTTSTVTPTWQRQTYRFYARGVGLVRETIIEETIKPGGAKSVIEHNRDLVAFTDDAQRVEPVKIKPAKPINAEQVRGVLLDSGGQPIAQVALSLQRLDQPKSLALQTDVSGRFAAGELDPLGSYVLIVRLTGYEPQELPLHSDDGSAVEVQIKLQRAAAPASRPVGLIDPADEWVHPILLLAGPTTRPEQSAIDEAQSLAEKGEHEQAVAKYRAYLKDHPDDTRASAYLAASLVALNRLDEAQATLDDAAAKKAPDYRVWQMQGQLQLVRGKIDQGVALYGRAAEASPRDAGAVYTDLAAALAAKNDPKLADRIEAALKSAAGADPPSLEALFGLGQTYAAAGRQEGRGYLQRYLAEAGKLPESRRDAVKMRLAKQMIKALDALRDFGGK